MKFEVKRDDEGNIVASVETLLGNKEVKSVAELEDIANECDALASQIDDLLEQLRVMEEQKKEDAGCSPLESAMVEGIARKVFTEEFEKRFGNSSADLLGRKAVADFMDFLDQFIKTK